MLMAVLAWGLRLVDVMLQATLPRYCSSVQTLCSGVAASTGREAPLALA